MANKRKLLDAHIHWWNLDENYYPWLCDNQGDLDQVYGEKTLSRNYLPEDYLKDASNYEIVGAVHIQADWDPSDDIGETRWLQTLADSPAMANFPIAIVAHADLAKADAEQQLQAHLQYSKVRGIRQILNYLPNNPDYSWASEDYLQNPDWLENFALLAKYKLSFDLMCFSNHMQGIAELAKKHPETPIILEHCGMPVLDDTMSEWHEGIAALAVQPNVFCKIGGLGTMIPKWDLETARPIFNALLDKFGIERLMFTTNFPTDSAFCDYNFAVSTFETLCESLTESQQQDFFVNNAKRIYRF